MYSDVLIGRKVLILKSNVPTLRGLSGVIVYESERTILLDISGKRRITVPKNALTISLENGKYRDRLLLEAKDILGTPQERIKG